MEEYVVASGRLNGESALFRMSASTCLEMTVVG